MREQHAFLITRSSSLCSRRSPSSYHPPPHALVDHVAHERRDAPVSQPPLDHKVQELSQEVRPFGSQYPLYSRLEERDEVGRLLSHGVVLADAASWNSAFKDCPEFGSVSSPAASVRLLTILVT